MKVNKMPTTLVLLLFSWLIAVLGLMVGVYMVIFRFDGVNSLIRGFSILLGSLLLAVIIRMLGNIGQMLFDIRADTQKLSNSLPINLQSLMQKITTLNQDLKTQFHNQTTCIVESLRDQSTPITEDLQAMKDNLEQLSCDLKDMNQNIHQIRTFFEQIERHLDLKK